MFASALRWNIRDCSFEELQQRLLHAFAGNVASDRRVLVLAANLVYFVDIYNALLRAFDVAVRGLQQFENNVLNVLADVTRFSQSRSIDDRKRNAQHARESLREQRLARSRGSDQEDVGFLNFDVGATAAELDALVVLINGDGQA